MHINIVYLHLQYQEVIVPLSLQVYQGLVYMDFSKKLMEEQGYGNNVTDVKHKVDD